MYTVRHRHCPTMSDSGSASVDEEGREEIDRVLSELEAELHLYPIGIDDVSQFADYMIPFAEAAASGDASERHACWTPVSDTLHASRKRRLISIHEVSTRVSDILGVDGRVDTQGRTIPDEFRQRLNRLYELVFYAHSFQECRQRVQQLLDASYASAAPTILIDRLFRPRTVGQKLSPYQRLLTFALSRLSLSKLRKYKDAIFEPIVAGGVYTYAWRKVCTIKEWVWRELAASSQLSSEMWDDATQGKGNIEALITYLTETHDSEFPTIRRNRRLLSFRNGVYVTAVRDDSHGEWVARFCAFDDAEAMAYVRQLTADGTVAAKFHDLQFPASLATATGRSFDADALASAAAPTLARICQWQEWGRDPEFWLYVFVGRMLHPIGGAQRLDGWQVIPMLLGLASTGKSTIVSDVVARFFEEDCYAYIVNNMEKQFEGRV